MAGQKLAAQSFAAQVSLTLKKPARQSKRTPKATLAEDLCQSGDTIANGRFSVQSCCMSSEKLRFKIGIEPIWHVLIYLRMQYR
uniref:Uncharacterized protein n=1 Tax=Romanomermis culicivorax TaxID=13658 RepID=A0A915JIU9_ROMCU